ncbi:MAG: hypothetical protein WD738_03975 [Pirellulales bacterium]
MAATGTVVVGDVAYRSDNAALLRSPSLCWAAVVVVVGVIVDGKA